MKARMYIKAKDKKPLNSLVQSCMIFSLHKEKPYIRQAWELTELDMTALKESNCVGWPGYLASSETSLLANHDGPFSMGLSWKVPANANDTAVG